jgi:hypothetical protein
MTDREEGELLESTRTVIAVVNDSLAGHARHAASLASRAADPNDVIDPMQELGRLWNRTIRDGALFFAAAEIALRAMSWSESKVPDSTPAPVERPPSSNPCPTTIGGAAATGDIVSQGLRRRGDLQITIPPNKVRVERRRNDPTQLDLSIEAGGMPRGLYQGTLAIGSAPAVVPLSYNIYVDF